MFVTFFGIYKKRNRKLLLLDAVSVVFMLQSNEQMCLF